MLIARAVEDFGIGHLLSSTFAKPSVERGLAIEVSGAYFRARLTRLSRRVHTCELLPLPPLFRTLVGS